MLRRWKSARQHEIDRCVSVPGIALTVGHLRSGQVMIQSARLPLREGCVMNSLRGWRDPRTGRVFGFQSPEQRQNFMIGRARFCDGRNRQMPVCLAVNKLGMPCRAAKMRGRSFCFRHGGTAAVKRARLAAAHLSGNLDRIRVEQHSFGSAKSGDFFYRKDYPRLVICPHDRNDGCVRSNGFFKVVQV